MNSASSNLKVAMSESSTNSTQSNGYCFCGMKIKRRTSWTDLNREEGLRHATKIGLRAMEEEIRARDEQLRLVEVEKKKLEEK
ncbi:UDP-glucosyl transferase 85A5, partial [Prunus dulcis]